MVEDHAHAHFVARRLPEAHGVAGLRGVVHAPREHGVARLDPVIDRQKRLEFMTVELHAVDQLAEPLAVAGVLARRPRARGSVLPPHEGLHRAPAEVHVRHRGEHVHGVREGGRARARALERRLRVRAPRGQRERVEGGGVAELQEADRVPDRVARVHEAKSAPVAQAAGSLRIVVVKF